MTTDRATHEGPSAGNLVLTFIRLKLRLLRNTLRRPEGFGLVTFTILAAILGGSLALWLRGLPPDSRTTVAPLLSSVILLGWWLAPLLLGVGDETIDTTRLAAFPLAPAKLAPALAATAVIGPGPLAVSLPLLALASRAVDPIGAILAVAAALITVALGAVSSRWLATTLGTFLRRRRARDLATVAAGLAGGALGLILQGLVSTGRSLSPVAAAEQVPWLAGLPIGWSGDAIGRAAAGEVLLPLLEIAGALALLTLLSWSWVRELAAALVQVEDGFERDRPRPAFLGTRPGPIGLLANIDLPMAATAAKEQRYLRRHPRYRVQVMTQAMVLLLGGAPFLSAVAEREPRATLLGCIPGLTAGVTGSNLIGSDGRSLWGEYVALPSLRPLLRGRSLTFAALGVGISVIVTVAVAVWTGGGRYVPAALGAAVGMALAGSGIGSFTSTVAPTTFPDDDNPNPFATTAPGSGCLNALGTFAGVLVGLAAAAPILYGLAQARHDDLAIAVTAVSAPAYGLAMWLVATRLAGRRLDRRAHQLLFVLEGS